MQPLLQKRLSGLGNDANAMNERRVGGFVHDEGLAGQKRDPAGGDPLEERAKRRVPRLRGLQRGNREEDAELRVDADVPVGVEFNAAAALATFAVLRQREKPKRLGKVRLEGVSPVGESVEKAGLETRLEGSGVGLEEDDLEDFPAAREEGGFFWKFVEKIRLEEEADEDFPRENGDDLGD